MQFPETTQGFNRYSYTDNNPLSYTDPSGFGYADQATEAGMGRSSGGSSGGPSGGYDGHDGTTHKDRIERRSGGPVPSNGIDWDGSAQKNDLRGSPNYVRPTTGILGFFAGLDDLLSGGLGVDPGLRDWHRDLNKFGKVSWAEVVSAAKKEGYIGGGTYAGNSTIVMESSLSSRSIASTAIGHQVTVTYEIELNVRLGPIPSAIASIFFGLEPGGGSVGIAVSVPQVARLADGTWGWIGEYDSLVSFGRRYLRWLRGRVREIQRRSYAPLCQDLPPMRRRVPGGSRCGLNSAHGIGNCTQLPALAGPRSLHDCKRLRQEQRGTRECDS